MKQYTVFLESYDSSHEGYYFREMAPDQLVYCMWFRDEPQPEPWTGSVEDIAKNLNLIEKEALKMSESCDCLFEIVLAPVITKTTETI